MSYSHLQRLPTLTAWLADQPITEFPLAAGLPYAARYLSIANYLNANVHPHVEKAAMIHDGGLLTDHGPNHIETVIARAGDLLSSPAQSFPQLTPYEVYLLLAATHFHDVGNIYGREGHEQKMVPIMKHLGTLAGSESVEKRAIMRIARAHGGRTNGTMEDTIEKLPARDPVLGKLVHYQTLAAVLRFADELSDDSHRAARVLGILGEIPKESEVYHAYARALHTVQVLPDDHIINLRFEIKKSDANRKLGKGANEVYLLDEIHLRTVKMHCEREYCMRFTHGVVRIDAIDVRVEVFEDLESMTPCVDPIGYRLRQRGYPGIDPSRLKDLCPEINIDGARLANLLNEVSS